MLCFLTQVRSSGKARVGVMHGKAVGKSFQPHLDLGSEGCWAGGPGRKGEGGTRLGRFGLSQDLAEAVCCMTANCLAAGEVCGQCCTYPAPCCHGSDGTALACRQRASTAAAPSQGAAPRGARNPLDFQQE